VEAVDGLKAQGYSNRQKQKQKGARRQFHGDLPKQLGSRDLAIIAIPISFCDGICLLGQGTKGEGRSGTFAQSSWSVPPVGNMSCCRSQGRILPRSATMNRFVIGAVLASVVLSGCNDPAGQKLNGTGSTFVQPIMNKWAEEYQKANRGIVNYEPIGSSAGVQRMATGLFDFACTDSPLNDAQLASLKGTGDIVFVPLVLGAVVPAYNLPGLKEPLTFSGPVLADIFLGKITRWDDKALQELNPNVTLPETPIAVLHRSDGSGTTFIWTDYLSKVSPDWRSKVGPGMTVAWPAGKGKAGNGGVAELVKSTPGGIGYLQLDYALKNNLNIGQVKNRSGASVKATVASVTAAAKSSVAEIPADLRFSITDAPGPDAYPVSGAVWAIAPINQSGGKGKPLADFLRWATHDGQEFVEGLHFARLPSELVERIDKKLDQIAGGSKQ
jgi:phosphate ABC transporter phosphate-binding protein